MIHSVSARPRADHHLVETSGDPGLAAAQQTINQDIVQAVESSSVGAKLDGTFEVVNVPSGFNYGITYGNNAYFNAATLGELDTLLQRSANGNLELLSAGSFSNFYAAMLPEITFNFSQADQNTMNSEDTAASAQIASVITEFTNAGGTFSNPLPFGGKIQDIVNQLNKAYGSISNLPPTLNALRNALASYEQIAGQSYALHNKYYNAVARLNGITINVTSPSAANGGLQTGSSAYYVSYGGPGGQNLPTVNQLLGWLDTTSNAITVSVDASSFDSTQSHFSVNGSGGFAVDIGDFFGVNLGGSATYTVDRWVTDSSSLQITLSYTGLAVFGAAPTALSTDNSTGWYANDILAEVVANGSGDVTGYQLNGSEYPIATTFGPGGTFSRLKTWVISNQPTMTMVFSQANASQILSDFQEQSTANVSFLGLFDIGSVSESYHVQSVSQNAGANTVTVTMGPPVASGTIPLNQQVAYVLGGVPSYPPNNV